MSKAEGTPGNRSQGPWVVLEGEYAGKRLLARIDSIYKEPAARGQRSIQIGVAIPFRRPRPDGFPNELESAALASLEDKLVRMSGAHAVLVGVVTTGGMREFILYSQTSDWIGRFKKDLQAKVRSHEVQVMAKPDPDWRIYQELAR